MKIETLTFKTEPERRGRLGNHTEELVWMYERNNDLRGPSMTSESELKSSVTLGSTDCRRKGVDPVEPTRPFQLRSGPVSSHSP